MFGALASRLAQDLGPNPFVGWADKTAKHWVRQRSRPAKTAIILGTQNSHKKSFFFPARFRCQLSIYKKDSGETWQVGHLIAFAPLSLFVCFCLFVYLFVCCSCYIFLLTSKRQEEKGEKRKPRLGLV